MAGEDDDDNDDDELVTALVVLCVEVVVVGVVTTEVEEDTVGIVGAVTGGALGGAGTGMFGSCMIFTSAQFLT